MRRPNRSLEEGAGDLATMNVGGGDIKRLRARLEAEKDRLREQAERLWQSGFADAETGGIGELSLYDQHPADLGSEVAARQTDLGLQQNVARLLDQVNRALQRIDDGTYGTCERCGRAIGRERLEALPYATMCIECQEQADDRGGHTDAGGGRELQDGAVRRDRPERAGVAAESGDAKRPVEERFLTPPFGRSFRDGDDYVAYDGEDTWQDLARYGTSNTPQDEPGSVGVDEAYTDADEMVGTVEPIEAIIDIGGRGVTEADIFPDPEHPPARRRSRTGSAGADVGWLEGDGVDELFAGGDEWAGEDADPNRDDTV